MMNREKWFRDSFLAGVAGGTVSLTVTYFLLALVREIVISVWGYATFLRAPAIQLLTMLVNILIFRFLLINYNREMTAKGWLFITVISTLVYFFILFRMRNS